MVGGRDEVRTNPLETAQKHGSCWLPPPSPISRRAQGGGYLFAVEVGANGAYRVLRIWGSSTRRRDRVRQALGAAAAWTGLRPPEGLPVYPAGSTFQGAWNTPPDVPN